MGPGASLLWAKAEGAGTLQLGREKAQGSISSVYINTSLEDAKRMDKGLLLGSL